MTQQEIFDAAGPHGKTAEIAAAEKAQALIRIVDDEVDVREALALMLRIEGWQAKCYESARQFLVEDDGAVPGCLVLDVRMPAMTGLELQSEMIERGLPLPIVFLTGYADIDVAVSSLKRGAVDFLIKPVDDDRLLDAIAQAAHRDFQRRAGIDGPGRVREALRALSERERDILELFMAGATDAQAAQRLSLSERTVQGHRAKIYRKFGIHTARELEALMPDIEAVEAESALHGPH